MKQFKVLTCGGTFDRFHKGHKEFLLHALALSDKVLIGITSDKYLSVYKRGESLDSYVVRSKAVKDFLTTHGKGVQYEISQLGSLYIPKMYDLITIDAILVSRDSLPGAKKINSQRAAEKKNQLIIVEHPFTLAEDEKPISSKRIRSGEIDRDGKTYFHPEWLHTVLYLPENLRSEIAKPFGRVIKELPSKRYPFVVTVGDVVTKYFHDRKIFQDIAVVDLKVERKMVYTDVTIAHIVGQEILWTATNEPGTLSGEVFRVTREMIQAAIQKKKSILLINGEEDLVVLPLLISAPLGWAIYYGQPRWGMVEIIVTEESKKVAYNYISSFKTAP